MQRTSTSIPIVFLANDAVFYGLVSSLARPGGNATGYSPSSAEMIAKVVFFLRDAKPGLRHVCALAADGYNESIRSNFEESCRKISATPTSVVIQSPDRIYAAISEVARNGAEALLLVPDGFTLRNSTEIINAATRNGVATVSYAIGSLAKEAGALACYSASEDETIARVVYLVDRILRGAKPADLPVEEPARYDLTINLKTARALGIVVPQSVLLQATDLVQ